MINAFRHQRFLHTVAPSSEIFNAEVINAFRHQRFLHDGRGGRADCHQCDQRLSASKIFALVRVSQNRALQGEVINAFRHQRFLHGIKGKAVVSGYEVINAFRHQRFLHSRQRNKTRLRLVKGDQRLSASKIFARYPPMPLKPLITVINAFRHQRFLHLLKTDVAQAFAL